MFHFKVWILLIHPLTNLLKFFSSSRLYHLVFSCTRSPLSNLLIKISSILLFHLSKILLYFHIPLSSLTFKLPLYIYPFLNHNLFPLSPLFHTLPSFLNFLYSCFFSSLLIYHFDFITINSLTLSFYSSSIFSLLLILYCCYCCCLYHLSCLSPYQKLSFSLLDISFKSSLFIFS